METRLGSSFCLTRGPQKNCRQCQAKRQINRLKCMKNEERKNFRILIFFFFSSILNWHFAQNRFVRCWTFLFISRSCEMKFKLIARSWRFWLFACAAEWSSSYAARILKKQRRDLKLNSSSLSLEYQVGSLWESFELQNYYVIRKRLSFWESFVGCSLKTHYLEGDSS